MSRAGSSRSSIVNNRVLRFGQEVASGNGVEVSGYAFTYGTHNTHHILAEALSPTSCEIHVLLPKDCHNVLAEIGPCSPSERVSADR